jgi:pyruvate dehydrogenase complex dehydrogenase (E1) component
MPGELRYEHNDTRVARSGRTDCMGAFVDLIRPPIKRRHEVLGTDAFDRSDAYG